jgi:hypothetical protein
MPSNISKINGLDIAAITAANADYVAAGNVDGPLGYNSITSASAALTASYIDPAFISASAAAYGFGSGGGGSTTAQTASYALSISSSTATADVNNRIALLSGAGTANILQNSNLSYNPSTNKLRVISGQFEAIGITGSLQGTASWATNAITASYALTSAGTVTNATSASFASTASYLNDLNQNVTINGNLSVFGTASYTNVSSSELNIGTSLITVNTSNPTNRFGGLAVIDSGSTPRTSGSILFDSVNDQWVFIHNTSPLTSSIFIQSPQTYNDLGNEINLTTNRVPKSTNAEHIGDSNISDTGTIVSINSATQITGSLTVTGNVIATASWANNATLATSASVIYGTGGIQNFVYVTDVGGGKQLFMHPSSGTARIDTATGHVQFTAVTASISGNLTGTASYATQALTASYALSSAGVAGGVTSITAGDGISVDQSTGNVTITNTGGGGGGTNLGLVYAVSLGYLMP